MNVLIKRLCSVFGDPLRDDVGAYLEEIARLTDHFGTTALDAAANALIRAGGRTWPAPKAIVDACVDAQETISARAPQKPASKQPWEIDTERARDWARDFCRRTELARRAFAEGWGRSVYLWAQSYAHDRLRVGQSPSMDARPTQAEIDYWFRNCRSLSAAMAHRGATKVVDFTELERVACLDEPLSPDADTRMADKLRQLRAGKGLAALGVGLKRMPVEDEEAA